jgi:hypothetical protein
LSISSASRAAFLQLSDRTPHFLRYSHHLFTVSADYCICFTGSGFLSFMMYFCPKFDIFK